MEVESQLLFYRLFSNEPSLSWLNRIASNAVDLAVRLKQLRQDPRNIAKIEGMFLGELIGIRDLVSKKMN